MYICIYTFGNKLKEYFNMKKKSIFKNKSIWGKKKSKCMLNLCILEGLGSIPENDKSACRQRRDIGGMRC